MTLTLSEVARRVEADSIGKVDYITPASNLRMDRFDPERKVQVVSTEKVKTSTSDYEATYAAEVHPMEMTDWAESQLLTRLGMPVSYFRRAYQQDPDLYKHHFNYWISKHDNPVMLRAKCRGDGRAVIRGVVSDVYSPFDNDTFVDILASLLEAKQDRVIFENLHLDDHRMHLRMTFPELSKDLSYHSSMTTADDDSRIGIDFGNSEVGMSSVDIQTLLFRLVCTNGLRGWSKDGPGFSQRHIHLQPGAMRHRIAAAMERQVEAGGKMIEDYRRTQMVEVDFPFSVIDKLVKEGGLPDSFKDEAKMQFEGDRTAYGVINSLTKASRALPNHNRLEAETFAGKLVYLPAKRWQELDTEEEVVNA